MCESRLQPDAISWDGSSYGVMQLNSIHAYKWPDFWERWMEPEWNIAHAHELYLEQGFRPWSCW